MRRVKRSFIVCAGLLVASCGSTPLDPAAGSQTSGGGGAFPPVDAGTNPRDAGLPIDAGVGSDAGTAVADAGVRDGGAAVVDAGIDRTCGTPSRPSCASSTEYCKFPVGACSAPGSQGTCEPRPTGCRWDGDSRMRVCGCRGNTYPTSCYAAMANEPVAKYGTCDECTWDSDCQSGEYCEMQWGQCNDTPPYECPKKTCEPCSGLTSWNDCAQHPTRCRWSNGRCEEAGWQPPPTVDAGCVKGILDACTSLADCGPGLFCINTLTPPSSHCTRGCIRDTDCGGAEYACVGNLCTRRCCATCMVIDQCAARCGGGSNGLSCGSNDVCGT
ncbi:MAG: hypothetical protein HYY84_19215 [Deltaproteobacteria bacterium]|nr:hypothetical protein [Deltaproteobacteria bacterium]